MAKLYPLKLASSPRFDIIRSILFFEIGNIHPEHHLTFRFVFNS